MTRTYCCDHKRWYEEDNEKPLATRVSDFDPSTPIRVVATRIGLILWWYWYTNSIPGFARAHVSPHKRNYQSYSAPRIHWGWCTPPDGAKEVVRRVSGWDCESRIHTPYTPETFLGRIRFRDCRGRPSMESSETRVPIRSGMYRKNMRYSNYQIIEDDTDSVPTIFSNQSCQWGRLLFA
jgi:hypothetical protein